MTKSVKFPLLSIVNNAVAKCPGLKHLKRNPCCTFISQIERLQLKLNEKLSKFYSI